MSSRKLDLTQSCLVTFHHLGAHGQAFWYPVELYEIDTLPDHLRCNPGTREVNLVDGTPVWKAGVGYMQAYAHIGLADEIRGGVSAFSPVEA